MNSIVDISFLELAFGIALMSISIYVFWYYKTGLVKATFISVARMTVQLLLVGLYLEFIFELNNSLVNIAWVLIMSILASYTIIQRSGLKLKLLFIPMFFSVLISIAVTDAYFLGFIIKLDNVFDARYFIPITGMILGNSIKNVIISMDAFYKRIDKEQSLYQWYLANGATPKEALLPFIRESIQSSFNPLIAATAVIGLITLPGIMTGQILGGSNPNVAVKYQIMLIITIFTSALLNVVLAIIFSNKIAFDSYGNLRKEIFK